MRELFILVGYGKVNSSAGCQGEMLRSSSKGQKTG